MDPKKLVLTLILAIGLLGLTVNLLTSRSPLSPATVNLYEYEHTEFIAFQKNFNKSYSDDQEYTKRFSIFRDNLAFINQHNAGSHTFTVGINQFADLTNEEFRAIYTKTMPKVNRDKNYVNLKESDLPDSIDWRQKGIVTPVKDQGQCGSCWAFSTTGAIEGAYAQKTGKLVAFSEQQLVDCSGSFGNHGCSGGLMDQAFSYLEQNALETEEDYNYTGVQGTCHYVAPDGKVKVANFVDVEPNNELALKAAVAERVVSVAVDAGDMGWQFYNGGVFGWPCGTELDHGVLAVGYGTEDYIEYWLVKNSWGSSWGEQGYIKIPRGDKAGEPGKCGIAINPSYPILA